MLILHSLDMEKRRNGTYEEGRPNLSKWFAYQYYNFPDNVPYKDTSMFALSDNVAGTEGHHSLMTKGMALYQLLGVKNNANRTIVTDIRTTIAENFFEKESNNTWKSLLNKRNKREVTSANEDINEAIIGFDKAGIALVDSQGNILSNIIRLKIVARLGYWDAQESGNVFCT